MILDNIQVANEEERIKQDERVSRNSIPFRTESFDRANKRAQELIKLRDEIIKELSEKVTEDVEAGLTKEQIIGGKFNFKAAAKIATLESEINILNAVQGPVEMIGTRAIRLIDKMYKEAKAKSIDVYSQEEKTEEISTEAVVEVATEAPKETIVEVPTEVVTEVATIPQVAPVLPIPPMPVETPVEVAPVTTPVVDVEKIVDENMAAVDASIQEAINGEEKISESYINDAIDAALGNIPVSTEPATEASIINRDEIEKIINEKLAAFVNEPEKEESFVAPVAPKVSEYVSVEPHNYERDGAMTDEEIAESQRKLFGTSEEEEYQRIMEEASRKEQEVAKINEEKGFNIEPVMVEEEIDNEPIRDEVVVTPEREERGRIVVKEEEKVNLESHKEESIEELAELIAAEEETRKQREKERENSEAELKKVREAHEKLLEDESDTKKKLEQLQAERERKEKELQELKVKLSRKLKALKNKNDGIESDIQKTQEEISGIREDDGKRSELLDTLNGEVVTEGNKISDIDEMLEKYGIEDEDTSVDSKIK